VTVRRIGCLLAIGVMLAAPGAPVVPHAAAVPHAGAAPAESVSSSSVAPVAIDLGGLFGNENEPDENEGGGDNTSSNSGTSLPVVLLLVLAALIVGAYGAIRVRRLWLRVRGWGRDIRARL
jgi:hypothetical protein